MLGSTMAACLAPPALAHRSQSVLSSVRWNASRKTLDVEHRIHADDAEIGLAVYAGEEQPLDLRQVRTQARLLIYLETHFKIATVAGPITLEPLGVEPLGREVSAFQEATLPAAPAELSIDNQILRDIFDKQTNLVNVRIADRTRTLIFAGGDKVKRATNLI